MAEPYFDGPCWQQLATVMVRSAAPVSIDLVDALEECRRQPDIGQTSSVRVPESERGGVDVGTVVEANCS
jgi:hypothetical protein